MRSQKIINKIGNIKPEYLKLEQFMPLELGEVASCDMSEAGGKGCDREKLNEIRAYSLLELCIVIDFYDMISKQADLMSLFPLSQPSGRFHVQEARQKYFKGKSLSVPDRASPDYGSFSEKNPENYLFDLLLNRGDLLRTYAMSDKRPTTQDDFTKRMKQVVIDRYYLRIACCNKHQEGILKTAAKGDWIREEGSKYGDDQPTYQRVFPHSLLVATQRKANDKVTLTEEVDQIIYDRAVTIQELFKSMIQ